GYTFYQNDPLGLPSGRRLDLRDETAVSHCIAQFQPHAIIHTAGSNRAEDLDGVIRRGTAHIVQAAAQVGARIVHLSTDSIFDGLEPLYDETAVPTPVNDYGSAKAAAEEIAAQYDNYVIVRTSLIYGLDEMDHSVKWMADALQAGRPITLFDNQFRNPVWVETLSLACLELAANDYVGILNVAGRQEMSRADFALKMFDWWGISEREKVTIGPSIGGNWPLDCRFDLSRATAVLTVPLLGVDEILNQRQ
ncbi:MAG: sugar nucleotide-binding protein, partial [Chloroflexi bacterium]|nr:sugar nucleotide-binding protein [Chloroflexota bacterium]